MVIYIYIYHDLAWVVSVVSTDTVQEQRMVLFTLVVDDFGVKFKDPAAADDLVRCLQLYYTLTVKKNATKFLGLTIAINPIAR